MTMKAQTSMLASALLLGGLLYLGIDQIGEFARHEESRAEHLTSIGALGEHADNSNQSVDVAESDDSHTIATSGRAANHPTARIDALIDPTSIKTYADIQRSRSDPYWRTSDGLSLRRKARFSCLFGLQENMKRMAKNPDIFKNDKSRRLSNEFLEKFCRDVPVESSESIWADSQLLPHTDDVYRASGLNELAQTDPELAVKLALDLISRSKSGGAIEMAMDFLHLKNVNVGLGHENFSGGDAYRSLMRAQEIAAQMVSCDYSRLCGPDSLRAWVECVQPGVCQPGVSMQLIWQRSNSPQIYEAAIAIANQLRAMRRQP
jgi:hypothetical protein